jgi:hypothetical protein
MVDPFKFVEVPTLVTRGGAVVAFSPFDEFVSVTDTGVEKVENGWSLRVLVDIGATSALVAAEEVACVANPGLL